MIPLTIIVDSLGGWLALAFILLFVLKAVLAAIGGDIGIDSDVDTDIDVNADGFGFSASDFFSLKGFLNFGVGFCSSWALFGLDSWWRALIAVGVGLITMFLLVFVYRACMKLEGTTVTDSPEDLLYRIGNVYAVTDNAVVIQMTVNGRIDELITVPDSGATVKDFKTGDFAFISRVELPSKTSIRFYSLPYLPDKMSSSTSQEGTSVNE